MYLVIRAGARNPTKSYERQKHGHGLPTGGPGMESTGPMVVKLTLEHIDTKETKQPNAQG